MRPTIIVRPVPAPPTADPLALTALRLRRSLAWPVGQAELILSPAVAPPEPGDQLQIGGSSDGDQATSLFTGRLLRRQVGLWGSRLLIEEATGPLARLHIDKAVRNGTAAKLIQELCQEAEVQAVVEPPGATLPAYALHMGASAMDHILRLARMSGLMVRTDGEGKLHAETPLPAPQGTLQREGAIVEYQADDRSEEPADSKITGDGAMGAKGPGAEVWLLQALDAMKAGDGQRSEHLPGLKTAADAARAATALAMREKERAKQRRLTLAGIPPVDLGEVILLTGFGPSPEPARLVAMTIRWDAWNGLISQLELNGIGV